MYILVLSLQKVASEVIQFIEAAQHRLQATRLRRRLAEGPRARTGLLSKVLRRTRRAPEPYR